MSFHVCLYVFNRYYAHSRSSEESEDFVVHRGRNVPTLSAVIRSVSPSSQDERSSPASRMSVSRNVSAVENEDAPAAGRPSDFKANKTSFAGRRSRRNSISEADSQLTVENFGGSQDNLNKFTISKNPDKQPAIVTDATSSPIRYVKRQSSQEPPDYYNNDSQNTPPSQHQSRERERDPSKRASLCESAGGSGGDVMFYGKKKLSVATMDHFQEFEDNQRKRDEHGHGQPSGNFNNFQSQNHNHDAHQQHGSPNARDAQHHSNPPTENGNVTVYVMNNNEGGGVAGGLSKDCFF